MRRIWFPGVVTVVMLGAIVALAADARVELCRWSASASLPRVEALATTDYKATRMEGRFLAKVTEEAPDLWGQLDVPPMEGTGAGTQPAAGTKKAAKPYTLAGQAGKYVGWFGIVRAMTWDGDEGDDDVAAAALLF